MSMRRPNAFRKTDITRAAKGLIDAGVGVGGLEVEPTGKFIILAKSNFDEDKSTDLDKWAAKHATQA
jgi:hypothetical protein